MLVTLSIGLAIICGVALFFKNNQAAQRLARATWSWVAFILCVALGAGLVWLPQRGGDRITLYEKRTEDSGAILSRINQYCYTKDADERTCRLYMKELVLYAQENPKLFLTARQKLNLPGDNTQASAQTMDYRTSVDPGINHHNLPQYGQIARTLAGMAKVIDTNAQAAAVHGENRGGY